MKALFAMVALCTFFAIASLRAADKDTKEKFPMSYHAVLKNAAGTKVEVFLEMQSFDWKAHKVEYNTDNYDGEWRPATPHSPHPFRVDGKEASGTDGGIPRRELKTFRVVWNGKVVKVPDKRWRDCFQLFMWAPEQLTEKAIEEGRWGTTFSRLSESGHCLMIVSLGGGGAGSYKVTWIVYADGRTDRFIERLDD